MKDLVLKNGGLLILDEEFKQKSFQENLEKYFAKENGEHLRMHSGLNLEIKINDKLKL